MIDLMVGIARKKADEMDAADPLVAKGLRAFADGLRDEMAVLLRVGSVTKQ